MLTNMLPGVIGIVASALIGIIGVFSNTQKNRILKVVLVVLLVLVAAASLHQESTAAQDAEMEREKTVYAESHAAQSLRELEEAKENFERAGEEHLSAQRALTERLEKNQELLQSLFGRMVTLNDKLETMQEAVTKGQRRKISEIGKTAREEARQTLMKVARQERLLPESEIEKLESDLDRSDRIPPAALRRIQENMVAKHQLQRSPDGTPHALASPSATAP